MNPLPLLQFPDDSVIKRVLRNMEPIELVGLTFLSKRTKNHVADLKITAVFMDVYVMNKARINFAVGPGQSVVCDFSFENEPVEFGAPRSILAFDPYEDFNIVWNNTKNLQITDWIEHFQFIFNRNEIDYLFVETTQFEVRSVCNCFKNPEIIGLRYSGHPEYTEIILREFQPKRLEAFSDNFPENKIPKSLLIQNLDSLTLTGRQEVRIGLEDLLLVNSKIFETEQIGVANEALNKFLKLRKKPNSNSRIEKMKIHVLDGEAFSEDVILKGLKAKKIKKGFEISGNQIKVIFSVDKVKLCFASK